MRLIELRISPLNDANSSARLVIERRRSDRWVEVEATIMYSDEEKRTLLLEDDERVVVDGTTPVVVAWDNEQKAAVPARPDYRQLDAERRALNVAPPVDPTLPESAIGVWREGGEQLWSRTGSRYRKE